MTQALKVVGRKLTYHLRHKPEEMGFDIELDGGWVAVTQVIKAYGISVADLQEIVKNDNKNRFSFNDETGVYNWKIRANQGHSIDINLGLPAIKPPEFLYHGTVEKFIKWIEKDGLKKMSRHHVHLSEDLSSAEQVASRRDTKNIILTVKSLEMYNDGKEFFLSENNVWLTEYIDPKYLIIP